MTNPLFALTRRRKIGILVSAITFLCLLAVLSAYYSREESTLTPRKGKHYTVRKRARQEIDTSDKRSKGISHRKRPEVGTRDEKRLNKAVQLGGKSKIVKTNGRKKKPKKQSGKRGIPKGTPVPAMSVKMAGHDNRFDSEKVFHLFSSCRQADDEILTDCYVDAYEELCKLFKAFGTVFTFVTSDVNEKIGILRDYRKSPGAEHYASVQSLLSYEVEKRITNNKKKASGARTLLRLHRALEFIEELLVQIRDTGNNDKFSTVASKAYDDTLAKHHPWLIKKAVHVAMYVLPSRMELLKKMNVEDSENGMNGLTKLIDEIKVIYKITQDLYAKDKLLELP